MTTQKYVYIEYEIPPLRAVYTSYYLDSGQSDQVIRDALAEEYPNARIRKIKRTVELPDGFTLPK